MRVQSTRECSRAKKRSKDGCDEACEGKERRWSSRVALRDASVDQVPCSAFILLAHAVTLDALLHAKDPAEAGPMRGGLTHPVRRSTS